MGAGYGYRPLCRVNNNGGASAQLISPVFDPVDILVVRIRIAGYSAASVARLRFNGDAGTTAYSYSVNESTGAATPVNTGASAVAAAAAGINVAVTAQVARALTTFEIANVSGLEHGIIWHGNSGSIAAATAPAIVKGAGIWATTNQITQITLDVGSGGGTLSANSYMFIGGYNL